MRTHVSKSLYFACLSIGTTFKQKPSLYRLVKNLSSALMMDARRPSLSAGTWKLIWGSTLGRSHLCAMQKVVGRLSQPKAIWQIICADTQGKGLLSVSIATRLLCAQAHLRSTSGATQERSHMSASTVERGFQRAATWGPIWKPMK